MPIYNAEPFLKQALDSVVNQTLKDIEIICVNDGSKDASLSIMRDYAAKDNRIVIIDKPNGGYGNTMNRGIKEARGEYIGILEPDDYLLPTMYEKLYKAAKQNNLDFARSNYNKLTTDKNGVEHLQLTRVCNKNAYYGKVLDPQDNLDLFNILMENWTGIYKTSWVRDHDIKFNESPGAGFQDNGFWFQSYCWATRIMVVDEPFYCYRIDNSASSINQSNKAFVMLDEYKWIENWLRSNPELCAKFMGIFQYKKTHNCEFAFSRLGRDFQLPYLERYANEYRTAFEKNEVDETLFWPDELNRLKSIVSDPKAYLDSYRNGQDKKTALENARKKGKLAVFNYYRKEEGTRSALKRTLGFLGRQ